MRPPHACAPLGRWPISDEQLKAHIVACHSAWDIAAAYGVTPRAVEHLAQKHGLVLAWDGSRRYRSWRQSGA